MSRREFYCETVLKMPPELGKQLLLETFFGKKVSNIDQWRDEAKAFLLSVESLGRLMRWVANEYFSDKELEALEADPKVKLFVHFFWRYLLILLAGRKSRSTNRVGVFGLCFLVCVLLASFFNFATEIK